VEAKLLPLEEPPKAFKNLKNTENQKILVEPLEE
jgi:hypothetical protein